MNSQEVYDFTDRPTTAPTANEDPAAPSTSSSAPAPSLEEEVQQVLGSLGRFWGGVRKQGQSALETARRDLGGVVEQAQRELGRLSAPAPASDATTPTPTTPAEDATATPDPAPTSPTATGSFFARLQSSLPPNLQQTLRSLESSVSPGELQHRAEELRTQFEAGLHRVQEGVAPTLQRVQEGVQPTLQRLQSEAGPRAEALFKDASTFLSDAVKVVPPPDSETAHGVAWDGSDIWDRAPDTDVLFDAAAKGKGKAAPGAAGLGRKEAMLRRIRTDAGLYTNALSAEEEALSVPASGPVDDAELHTLLAELVPAQMSADAFWARYHLRVHQVEADDERRRALLAAQSAQQDDELSAWDDEDDAQTLAPKKDKESSESEASYDVVSGAASPAPPTPQPLAKKETKAEDDADSDWE